MTGSGLSRLPKGWSGKEMDLVRINRLSCAFRENTHTHTHTHTHTSKPSQKEKTLTAGMERHILSAQDGPGLLSSLLLE